MKRFRTLLALLTCLVATPVAAESPRPVTVALDAEFGLKNSTSAQSIEMGIRTAIAEINRAGGVLGRPMDIRTSDNRSVPMRGVENLKAHADDPDVLAVFAGRFSPVVIEVSPVAHARSMILMAPWSSADGIIDQSRSPNWVFRLSLRDEYAMPAMIQHAKSKGLTKVGLLLTNTAWGRSNKAAAERNLSSFPGMSIVGEAWFNWGEKTLMPQYQRLLAQGAEAILFVTNDVEGSLLIRELGTLPQADLRPVIFHWGITGGTFVQQSGPALEKIDHAVVQTFNFAMAEPGKAAEVLKTAQDLFGIESVDAIEAPVGFAHAYDLTHILARAAILAGSTDRAKVRDALEQVRDYDGLVRQYARPFAPNRHEALTRDEVFMARFRSDGVLVPVGLPVGSRVDPPVGQ